MIICLCIFSIISHFVKCHCHTSIAYMYSYSHIIPCYRGSVKAFRRQSVCFRVHKRSRIVNEHTRYEPSQCGQLTTTAIGSLPLAGQFIGWFSCAGSLGIPGSQVAQCLRFCGCFDTRFLGVLPPFRFCVRYTSGSRPARIDMIGIAPWGASGGCRADMVTSFPGERSSPSLSFIVP